MGSNSNCIDVLMAAEAGGEWRANFVYGEPQRDKRHEFFNLMRQLCTHWSGPWICCGDFNEVLSQDEYYGSNDHSDSQIRLFQECLDDCALLDMGFSGPMFTWSNNQDNDRNFQV
jgi:hypothetical protein